MKIEVPLRDGIGLKISSARSLSNGYATAQIQKGWLLSCDGQDLSEEAVGFGVPVLKRGLQTIFPGEVSLSADDSNQPLRIHAVYKLCLEEKLSTAGSQPGDMAINNRFMYATKNILAGMIRGMPGLRRTLTNTSSLLRAKFGWQTIYAASDFSTEIMLTYSVLPDENKLQVELTPPYTSTNHISEIVIMNEQGAHYFDEYRDDARQVRGSQIGCWDEVSGNYGMFISQSHRVAFSLPRIEGTRLFHGRELVGNRLAWSGFGYSFSPSRPGFSYQITLHRLP